jgi:UDP-N-acetylglucosamine transferase subunit ALG13
VAVFIKHPLDVTDHILMQANCKAKSKAIFHDYFLRFQKKFANYSSKISRHSWFDVLTIVRTIKHLVYKRPHLQHSVGIFPVFDQTKLQAFTRLRNETQLLRWFIEAILESPQKYHLSLKNHQQFIIPLLIEEHYSVVVISLFTQDKVKTAQIQHYNSFGQTLGAQYISQLKGSFAYFGYRVTFSCQAEPEQQDTYNCGLLICLKAIEIASKNAGKAELLLPLKRQNREGYQQLVDHYRYQVAKMLVEEGYPISICPQLAPAL